MGLRAVELMLGKLGTKVQVPNLKGLAKALKYPGILAIRILYLIRV